MEKQAGNFFSMRFSSRVNQINYSTTDKMNIVATTTTAAKTSSVLQLTESKHFKTSCPLLSLFFSLFNCHIRYVSELKDSSHSLRSFMIETFRIVMILVINRRGWNKKKNNRKKEGKKAAAPKLLRNCSLLRCTFIVFRWWIGLIVACIHYLSLIDGTDLSPFLFFFHDCDDVECTRIANNPPWEGTDEIHGRKYSSFGIDWQLALKLHWNDQ